MMNGATMAYDEAIGAARPRLAALYEQHAPDAIRAAYLLAGGDRALAEDLVQDAFVRVATRFADLRDPSAFAAYLRKTIVNLARQHFRARGRERHRETAAAPPAEVIVGPTVEDRDEIVRALALLPERQRAALVLRYYLDLTESDTADALGCRIGTVKSLTSRGLAALREHVTR